MRQPRDWDEEYILALPVGEHRDIEAKGRATIDLTLPKVDEAKGLAAISRSISAFANSRGGVLLLGVNETTTGWEIDDGGVALVVKGRTSTREWLEDVIPKLLKESLVNFDVYVVLRSGEGSQIAEGRGVFVIEIRDSERAPHQANDFRYYARLGGKTQPIDHWLVMDIANRRQHPKMELGLKFRVVRRWSGSGDHPILKAHMFYTRHVETVLEAHAWVTNKGRVLAKYVNCFIGFPALFAEDEEDIDDEKDGKPVTTRLGVNTRRDIIGVKDFRTEYGPSWFDPILPGLSHSWDWQLGEVNEEQLRNCQDERIYWKIYADNAAVEKGVIRFGDVEVQHVDLTQEAEE